MFSEKVKNALIEGGWSPTRKVDTKQYERALCKEGYVVSTVLIKFLMQFGGLILKHPHTTEPTSDEYKKFKLKQYEIMHFDPIKELGIPSVIPMDKEKTYDSRAKDYLTPFGAAFDNHIQLLMAPTGKIYGQYGSYFTLLGDNSDEMFENIYNRVKTPEIP